VIKKKVKKHKLNKLLKLLISSSSSGAASYFFPLNYLASFVSRVASWFTPTSPLSQLTSNQTMLNALIQSVTKSEVSPSPSAPTSSCSDVLNLSSLSAPNILAIHPSALQQSSLSDLSSGSSSS
jgi:hypothetical protein